MTEAEKWSTLAQVLAVTVPTGALIGLGLGWLIGGDSGESTVAGAVIGFFVTAGFVTFDVSWAEAFERKELADQARGAWLDPRQPRPP